jgi:hypothetical protein
MAEQYRYDYNPDAAVVERDSRELRSARQQVLRRPNTPVGQLQQQLEQQLGIGSRTVDGRPARMPMQTMQPPAGMPPAPPPPARAVAPIAPATRPKMDASQAAAHFLAEARQQMDVLNAGRRNGSIDANLDRQMMSQINHLLTLHNEAKSYISTMPPQPAPQPQQAPPPKPAAPKPAAKPAAEAPSSLPPEEQRFVDAFKRGYANREKRRSQPAGKPATPKPAAKAPAKAAPKAAVTDERSYRPSNNLDGRAQLVGPARPNANSAARQSVIQPRYRQPESGNIYTGPARGEARQLLTKPHSGRVEPYMKTVDGELEVVDPATAKRSRFTKT